MTKENADAIKVLTETMNRIADESVDQADYDRTRNARITKVYKDYTSAIIGYDIEVDGKSYHINKERGKGIIARENDIVKLHIPCNNMNNLYLSYPHDPEDYVKSYIISTASNTGVSNYISYETELGSNVGKLDFALGEYRTFSATTKQFSSILVTIPWSGVGSGNDYFGSTFQVSADEGVLATFYEYGTNSIIIKCYNENPTTTDPVTKFFNIFVSETACPVI